MLTEFKSWKSTKKTHFYPISINYNKVTPDSTRLKPKFLKSMSSSKAKVNRLGLLLDVLQGDRWFRKGATHRTTTAWEEWVRCTESWWRSWWSRAAGRRTPTPSAPWSWPHSGAENVKNKNKNKMEAKEETAIGTFWPAGWTRRRTRPSERIRWRTRCPPISRLRHPSSPAVRWPAEWPTYNVVQAVHWIR